MNPINIKLINTLILQKKRSSLSNFAQIFVRPQIKSISYTLEKLISEINANTETQNIQKLYELGIKEIGKDISQGVIISGKNCDYHIFSSNNGVLNFNFLKTDTNQVFRHLGLNSQSDEYLHAGDFSGINIEDTINELLDFADSKLFKAKRILTSPKSQQSELPTETITPQKAIINIPKNYDIANAGYIDSKYKELIESIHQKFSLIQELYKKINDGRTKYKLRSAYPNYLPQPVMNKIGFKNIGPKGESISLFDSSYKKDSYTGIIITGADGKESNFVISNDKGFVQKNLPSKYVKSDFSGYRIYITPNYYTQKEIDESNLYLYLSCLNKEMDSFIEHTQNWFKIKLIKSNYNCATINEYKDLIDDIFSNFEKYRVKIRKYFHNKTEKKQKFKTENNISTKLASTAVKFDRITKDGNDLRLSFPKVRGNIATQILVMDGDEIKKSFFIINNKLLRFDIKKLSDKIVRYNKNLYYYDNQYLQESNLPEYLILLRDKLQDLNCKLDTIKEKHN